MTPRTTLTWKALVMALRAPFLTRRSPPPTHRPLFGNGDFAKAAVLIRESFESKAAARTGFDIVLEVGAMHRQGGGS